MTKTHKFAALKQFANTVGVTLRKTADGFQLSQSREPICIENDLAGIVDALEVYASGHAQYEDAKADYELAIA